MRLLSRRLLLAAAVAAVAATSCLSPTLPLPPPSKPTIDGPDPQGNVTVTGNVLGNSTVFVENARLNSGVFEHVGNNGQYKLVLPAQVNDELWIWYTQGTDESPVTIVTVP
jgi:hypothetical protein